MSAPSVPSTDDRIRVETADRCSACPHAVADHDAISLRYCSASRASGVAGRGCVCPKR